MGELARESSPAVATAAGPMRFAYADPPYPGKSRKYYRDHPDYAGGRYATELSTESWGATKDDAYQGDGVMFERFTERARQVVVLAQEEARNAPHNHIGAEHILLGLLREEEGCAAQALTKLGVTLDDTRAAVLERAPVVEQTPNGQIPFTPRAKEICELALREALSLGHNYIGTEHILLGLVRKDGGIAREILDATATPEQVRDEVLRLLTGKRSGQRRIMPTTKPLPARDLEDRVVEMLGSIGRLTWLCAELLNDVRSSKDDAPSEKAA